jgi:hypothetical protein
MSKNTKEQKQVLRRAEKAGCTIEKTAKGHVKVRCPNGQIIITAATPSDCRVQKNFIARLRREGVQV